MSREGSLIKNTLILSLGTFLPKLTTLITLPILTKYLTKSEYGVYDLINTLVSLVIPLITMKLEMGTFRFLIDCREDKEKSSGIISSSVTAVVPISMVAVIATYVVLRCQGYTPVLSVLICMFFFLDNIYTMFQQVARGLGHNFIYSVAAIVNSVVNMGLIVVLVWQIKIGLSGLLLSLDMALLVTILFLMISLRLHQYYSLKMFSRNTLKEMLSYSWPLVPNSLSSWVVSLSDRLIVTAILGIEVNAVYAVANKIPSLFNTLQGTFISAWHENASVSIGDKDSDDYYSHMFDAVFTIMIGIMAGLVAVTPLLFKILINQNYAEAYYQMPFLFGGMICFSLSSFMGGIYAAHKKTKSVGITTVVAAAANLIIDLLLIHFIGLYAASISTFVSYLFLIVFRMIDVKKFQPMKYQMKKIAVYSLAIVAMCVISFINNFYMNLFNLVFGVAFAFYINRKIVKVLWTSIRNKKKNRKGD